MKLRFNKRRNVNLMSFVSGFTLVEFIVVMAIISVLTLMATPKLYQYIEMAKIVVVKNDIVLVKHSLDIKSLDLANEGVKIDFKDYTGKRDNLLSIDSENVKDTVKFGPEVNLKIINTSGDGSKDDISSMLDIKTKGVFILNEDDKQIYYRPNK